MTHEGEMHGQRDEHGDKTPEENEPELLLDAKSAPPRFQRRSNSIEHGMPCRITEIV